MKTIQIMTWNICCLPRSVNIYHNPQKAINKIINQILNSKCEIIKLQEVFDLDIKNKIIEELEKENYNIHTTKKKKNYMSTNGLLTGTKFDIISKKNYFFKNNTSFELLIDKGILSTQIKVPNIGNIYLHNTHLQSSNFYGLDFICKKSRNFQYLECLDYFKTFPDDSKQIFSGDLNDDFSDKDLENMFKKCNYQLNPQKIITFPKNKKQLDYITFNFDCEKEYTEEINKFSDHYALISKIKL